MTRYDGRLMTVGRPNVTGGLAWKKQTLATQVWANDSVSGSAADTLYFGRLPKGAIITGGRVFSGRLASGATAASSCLGFCLGFDATLANASGTSYGVASNTSALGVFSPIDFSVIIMSSVFATKRWESGFEAPLGGLLLTQGPLTVTADGSVFATMIASAGTGSGISGYLNLELDYYTGTYT